MTDPIEPVRSQLAERYAEQLEACDGLRQFALDIRTPWGGRPLDDDMKHEAILVVISSRSLNTFWSAVELARIGFGQQAAMLIPLPLRRHDRRPLGDCGARLGSAAA